MNADILAPLLAAGVNPTDDILSKLTSLSQLLSLPVVTGIFLLVWDNWKKSKACYEKMFGDPNDKDDDGVIGSQRRIGSIVRLHEIDLNNLCAATDIKRATEIGV